MFTLGVPDAPAAAAGCGQVRAAVVVPVVHVLGVRDVRGHAAGQHDAQQLQHGQQTAEHGEHDQDHLEGSGISAMTFIIQGGLSRLGSGLG